jgi:hypothetical protein
MKVIASVTVLLSVPVDMTMRMRVPQPEIWRPRNGASDLPFTMPAPVEVLMRLTPAKTLRPSVASATAHDTWPGPTMAAYGPSPATVAACSASLD